MKALTHSYDECMNVGRKSYLQLSFSSYLFYSEMASSHSVLTAYGCNGTGHLVSGYVKQHLPIILVNHMTTEKNIQKTLTSGFIEVDKSLGNSRIDCEFSGTTAVVSYLKVNFVLLA